MILVTGAGGKTGLAVINALAARGERVRGLVYRDSQASRVTMAGAYETITADMGDLHAFISASRGAKSIYHIAPNVSPNEVVYGSNALAAAITANVEHFVFHSVLHPQVEEMPHHLAKLRVEELIFQSGLPFTIMQPTAYMQNTLAQWGTVEKEGLFRVPYRVNARLSLVDLHDAADAGARVLTEPDHQGATYELCGPDAFSQDEVALAFSEVLQIPVRAVQLPLDEWEKDARSRGMGDYAIDTLKKMFNYYERYSMTGNANVLNWLLKRKPTSFNEFLNTEAEQRRPKNS